MLQCAAVPTKLAVGEMPEAGQQGGGVAAIISNVERGQSDSSRVAKSEGGGSKVERSTNVQEIRRAKSLLVAAERVLQRSSSTTKDAVDDEHVVCGMYMCDRAKEPHKRDDILQKRPIILRTSCDRAH